MISFGENLFSFFLSSYKKIQIYMIHIRIKNRKLEKIYHKQLCKSLPITTQINPNINAINPMQIIPNTNANRNTPSSWSMKIQDAQLEKQIIKLFLSQGLREDIRQLVSSRDIGRRNKTTLNFIMNEITIHLNMLCTLILNRIISNMKSRIGMKLWSFYLNGWFGYSIMSNVAQS